MLHDFRNNLPQWEKPKAKDVDFIKLMNDRMDTIRQQINAWETYDGRSEPVSLDD